MILIKMFCLLGICIAGAISRPEHYGVGKDIAMKSSGNLPGCNGHITYTIDANVNPILKTSVFRITEAISCDECAHLCHTHYFCRSAGFEPNNRVESGGLCYLSYKESRKCIGTNASSQRVTDFQATEPVWIDCDVCTDPLPNIESSLNSVPIVDEDFKGIKNELETDKTESPTPLPEFTSSYNRTEDILPLAEILPLPEFTNRSEEGSGDD